MIAIQLATGMAVLLLAAGSTPTPSPPATGGEGAVRMVRVEGVAGGPQAAPVAVLREIGERVRGRSFSLMYGEYVAFLPDAIPPALETKRTRMISVEKLPTGLFKATMEVDVAPEPEERLDRIRERIQRGESKPTSGGLILAREEAREDALEKGILAAVAEQYPGDSAPARLAGRVYFLGTIREEFEEGRYVILARLKVRLFRP
jgi:hypothetical protein